MLCAEMRMLISWDMFFVLVFSACCFMLELPGVLATYERPVPGQKIEVGGGEADFVKGQVWDQVYVPDDEQVVPGVELVALSFGLPLGGLLLGILLCQQVGDAAAFMKGFLLAMACSIACVDLVKNYVGYLRPYFYSECGFDESTGRCTHDKADAHRSFPSGHSSMSFAAMLFLSLYALGKVNAAVSKPFRLPLIGDIDLTNVLLLLALSPMAVAFWISSSRIRENDHHPADVVGGAVIGSAWAVFWYSRYYPSIWDENSARPRTQRPKSHDAFDDDSESTQRP
mmetsp:Transcript_2948/g.3412  ORF Transcript_2948/g.3412 Transcript_2948/m.3412 type:complete len:284 (+) Transcript_2948:72-923(+)